MFGGAIYRRFFCVTGLEGLVHGGAYFRNFTVSILPTHMGNWNSSPLDLCNTRSGLVSPSRCSVY